MPLSNSAGPSRAPMITNVKIAPDRLGVARGRWHAAHSIDPHCFRVCAWQRLNFLTAALRQYLPIIAIPVVAHRFTWRDAAVRSEFGADRKWLAERQTDATDSTPTSFAIDF